MSNSTSLVRYLIEKNIFNNVKSISSLLSQSNNNSELLTRDFLNVQDNEGKTVLHLSCQLKSVEIVRLILNTGMSDVNLRDLSDRSALSIANQMNSLDICELLIRNGARVDDPILVDVCSKGNLSLLNILLKYNFRTIRDKLRSSKAAPNSYLFLAVKYSFNLKFINELLDLGVRPVLKDMFELLDDAKSYLSSNSCSNSGQTSTYFLECMILLLKYNCFESFRVCSSGDLALLDKHVKCLRLNENFSIEFDDRNAGKLVLMILFQIVCDFYNANRNKLEKQRLIYAFALAIYSAQLNNRKV
jgi:hypothetical protein